MNVNYDDLIPKAEGYFIEFQGCQEPKVVEYQGRQIVVIGNEALILFKNIEKEPYTLGWSFNRKTVVVAHRHNGGDPNPLYAQCEKIRGIAKPLFSFETANADAQRVDVMELHPHFPHQYDSVFINNEKDLPQEIKDRFSSWYKAILQCLSERGISITNVIFFSDYVAQQFYLIPTTFASGPLKFDGSLRQEDFIFPAVQFPLHEPYKVEEVEGMADCNYFKKAVIAKSKSKVIYKAVSKQGRKVSTYAVSVISPRNKARFDLERKCAEILKGSPGIVSIISTSTNDLSNNLEIVYPLFPCDFQQACGSGWLEVNEKIGVLRDAAIGVKSYQKLIGVYCDFKPENILVNPNEKPVRGYLTDFGGGVEKGSNENGQCSILYASPEMLQRLLKKPGVVVTNKHDSWSMGATILNSLYFITLDDTFVKKIGDRALPNEERLALIEKELYNFPNFISSIPPVSIKDLIRRLLKLDPDVRPSMEEIIQELTALVEGTRSC